MILKSTPKCYLVYLLIWMSLRQKYCELLERYVTANVEGIKLIYHLLFGIFAVASLKYDHFYFNMQWRHSELYSYPQSEYGLSFTSSLILKVMTYVLIFLFSNLFWGLFFRRPLLRSQIFNLYPRNRNIICRLNRGQHFTWTAQTNGISHTSYIYRSEMTGSGKHVFHVAQ